MVHPEELNKMGGITAFLFSKFLRAILISLIVQEWYCFGVLFQHHRSDSTSYDDGSDSMGQRVRGELLLISNCTFYQSYIQNCNSLQSVTCPLKRLQKKHSAKFHFSFGPLNAHSE